MSPSTVLITFTALTANTIRSQPLCKSDPGKENKSCCVPNCRSDCVYLCPKTYFLLQNNSRMLCSKTGEIKENGMFNTPFFEEPFCTRTCPEGYHASNNESILLCIQCKASCKVKKFVKVYNTTETNTNLKESEISKIAIVLSAVAVTVCILILSIVCFLNKKRLCTSCGRGRTRYMNRNPSEMENGKKLEDFENVQSSDAQGRNENGYVKDPTTGIQRENGTDNDAYDYAEESADSAATEQDVTDLYANQTLTADHKHDRSFKQNPSDHHENKNALENQALSGESNISKEIENEDNYYVNQLPLNNFTDYENTKFSVNATEKVVAVFSNCVTPKNVNDMTAVNTNTINVNHAENKKGGKDNEAYDYAEERIVSRNAYITTENTQDNDDGYQVDEEDSGPASSAADVEMDGLYANQIIPKECHIRDETFHRTASM
ncbi:unnamed protein product [Mytilus coruscus]|uniref:Uncharacterized protein n=1 Tax=Mytilus coruscus TaxID=42192 RepID=A0A6J8AAR7_MYTCO|nr:unnamed protein product [Mytilus coruscus]